MKKNELCTKLENYQEIYDHIKQLLSLRKIDNRSRSETLLVFEALYGDMMEHGIPKDTPVTVWRSGSFGNVNIKIRFKGKLYAPLSDDEAGDTVEERVLSAFGDKIDQRYHDAHNTLSLTTKRSASIIARNNVLSIVFAVAAYFLVAAIFDTATQQEMIRGGIVHAEKLFTDAILSVGAPITFFSLLRNLTDMYLLREGNARVRWIQGRALTSSAISVVLAFFTSLMLLVPMCFVVYFGTYSVTGSLPKDTTVDLHVNTTQLFESLVSPNLLEPFQTFAPFPIILLVILTTYAMCSAGSYFNSIKKVVDGGYVLFSRMLNAIMYTLPLFSFLAILDGMLMRGPEETFFVLALLICVPLGMIAMVLFYSARLVISGVRPWPFIKQIGPLIKENLLINSTIDAVPFNTRYCITKYGFDRKRVERDLPMLAQINLNGNCFIITLIAMLLMLVTGMSITWFDVIIVALVVFCLSLGAPNQPGSILIGMLIILSYMRAMDIIALAIVCEALFGRFQSITNAVGDIVTVAITDKREKGKGADADEDEDESNVFRNNNTPV